MTIDLIDCGTRFLVTLKSGWGVKFTRSEAKEVVDLLAEQGVHATVKYPPTKEAVEQAREFLSRVGWAFDSTSTTKSKPKACTDCCYFIPFRDEADSAGMCHWDRSPSSEDANYWCSKFKRGKEGSKE